MTSATRGIAAASVVALSVTTALAIHVLSTRSAGKTAALRAESIRVAAGSGWAPPSPSAVETDSRASTPGTPTAQVPPTPLDPTARSEEAALMARLRAVEDKDPALALDLAQEGNRRFPESPEAPERAAIAIHALAAQGHASEARGAAEEMVNHYPDSIWVREVERFTGAHRHRNLRLNAQGQLESY